MEVKKTRLMLWTIALMPTALWGNMLVPVTARAQIAPDGTLPTEVMQNGNNFTIDGGQRAGGNLFHSFQEFSVPTGGRAYFNNSMDVENIFSRVTGGKISNIDGLIRANGSANLFLLNPAGIVFGPNARLNIGGSFLGSTASSLLFPNGQEFSTINKPSPLLTINAPIGLWFRRNEGNIVNESIDLKVEPGQSLGLVGGNVRNGGRIEAPEGRVELGGLAAAGTVGLNNDGSLSFPEGVVRGNVSFADSAIVDVKGEGGGTITVNANDVKISGRTLLQTGIGQGLGSTDARAGDITLDATGAIEIDRSGLLNQVSAEALGDGGNIEIKGRSLSLRNGAELENRNLGSGNAGNVTINVDSLELTSGGKIITPTFNSEIPGSTRVNAATSIRISGSDPTFGLTGIFADVETGSTGNGNELRIETGRLLVENGGAISTGTLGSGKAGSLNISATESVEVRSNGGLSSDVGVDIAPNGMLVPVPEAATGSGGGLTLSTGQLILKGGGTITSITAGEGDAGDVNISATESVEISGRGSVSPSGLFTNVAFRFTAERKLMPALGNGGNLQISTAQLIVENGAQISTSTLGEGSAGNLTISNAELVKFSGDGSGLSAQVLGVMAADGTFVPAIGDGGNVQISTNRLIVQDGASVSASTFGKGDAGNLTINATESIEVRDSGGLFAQVNPEATGDGGSLQITTGELLVRDGARVSARTFEQGNANDLIIKTDRLIVESGGQISASTFGEGDAGDLTINASELIELTGTSAGDISGIFSSAIGDIRGELRIEGKGDAGNVDITTEELIIQEGASIGVGNFPIQGDGPLGLGNPGDINIHAETVRLNNGSITAETVAGDRGNIGVNSQDWVILQNNSQISANATGEATGGNIFIKTDFLIAYPGNNDITANAVQESGGNINITAEDILGIEKRDETTSETNDITVSSDFGPSGEIKISILEVEALQGRVEPSDNSVEADEAIAQACRRDPEGESSSFTIVGRGGIPRGPQDPLTSDTMRVEGKLPSQTAETRRPIVTLVEEAEPISPEDIVLARGWIVNEDGVVELTAYPTPYTSDRPFPKPVRCPRNRK